MGGGHHVFIRKKCGEGKAAADMNLINSVCPNVRERQSLWQEQVEIHNVSKLVFSSQLK